MRISTKELKKIIMEEYTSVKNESSGDRLLELGAAMEDALRAVQIATGKANEAKAANNDRGRFRYSTATSKHIQDCVYDLHEAGQQIEFLLESLRDLRESVRENALTSQISKWSQEGEAVPQDQTVGRMEGPQEEIARVVQDTVDRGLGLQDIGTALESAGMKVVRGNRYIMVHTAGEGKFAVASTSQVDLDGSETLVQGPGGVEYAVGTM